MKRKKIYTISWTARDTRRDVPEVGIPRSIVVSRTRKTLPSALALLEHGLSVSDSASMVVTIK